jgi:hypothetical protein
MVGVTVSRFFRRVASALVLATLALPASPHPGSKDEVGCHAQESGVIRHCHDAEGNELPWPPVKKSRSDICHDRDSQWYAQTIHFEPFNTMRECLDSGGQLPKL